MFFCEDCGKRLDQSSRVPYAASTLPSAQAEGETSASFTALPSEPVQEPIRPITWGTAHLTNKSTIQLRFMDTNRSIELTPAEKLIIGRADQTSATQPDIDLMPYGALENGVSRIHASLEMRHDTLVICDLGSSNGTYVNNLRLPAHQPHLLRDGDEVRFGKLVAYLHFA
jgi:pSer/pThr/pTyr-binding forkhead associated (FHA) protein